LKPAGRAIVVAARSLLGMGKMDEGYNDKKQESEDQADEMRIPSFHFSVNDYSTRAALKLTKISVALNADADNEYRNACWCLGPWAPSIGS